MAKKSRILIEMHETMKDMHEMGHISDAEMLETNAICFQEDVPDYTPDFIADLRHKWNLTQSMFADIINSSISTVQQWETGQTKPSRASRKLLHILETKGLQVLL